MLKDVNDLKVQQISNYVFCDARLNEMNIESKLLPNPYYDYPYMIISDFLKDFECDAINEFIKKENDFKLANLITKDSINLQDKKLDRTIRNTNIYKLDEVLEKLYFEKFRGVQKTIEDYFKLVITSSTDIQALEYNKGFFIKHIVMIQVCFLMMINL